MLEVGNIKNQFYSLWPVQQASFIINSSSHSTNIEVEDECDPNILEDLQTSYINNNLTMTTNQKLRRR